MRKKNFFLAENAAGLQPRHGRLKNKAIVSQDSVYSNGGRCAIPCRWSSWPSAWPWQTEKLKECSPRKFEI